MRKIGGIVVTGAALLAACAPSDGPETALWRHPSGLAIAVERRQTHEFLAEYDRRVVVRTPGASPVVYDLDRETGGYARVNVHALGDSALILRDAFGAIMVPLDGGPLRDLSGRPRGDAFVGSFDEDDAGRWRFLPAPERPEQPVELRGG